MWIYTRNYFASIVDNREDYRIHPDNELTVRFRRKDHAQAFHEDAMSQYQAREDGPRDVACSEIRYTPRRDYPYRVVVTRSLVGRVIGRAAAGINYPNFKDIVKDEHDVYNAVWATTLDLEDDDRREDMPEWEGQGGKGYSQSRRQ